MVNSRLKGVNGEREARDKLNETFPGCNARRGQQFKGSPDSPDVVHDLRGIHFEVKRTEKLRLEDAMAQAANDCGDDVPVVLHRKSGQEWVAIVRLADLPELVTRLYLGMAELR